jgi:hypothetical protein
MMCKDDVHRREKRTTRRERQWQTRTVGNCSSREPRKTSAGGLGIPTQCAPHYRHFFPFYFCSSISILYPLASAATWPSLARSTSSHRWCPASLYYTIRSDALLMLSGSGKNLQPQFMFFPTYVLCVHRCICRQIFDG